MDWGQLTVEKTAKSTSLTITKKYLVRKYYFEQTAGEMYLVGSGSFFLNLRTSTD